mmetsp:Transcript_2772/g.6032  ORF Transcript_2772/g.6032 Transcript_2772/m.6032 type:complete len:107 (+) Transcript_2772:1477-1797(+)
MDIHTSRNTPFYSTDPHLRFIEYRSDVLKTCRCCRCWKAADATDDDDASASSSSSSSSSSPHNQLTVNEWCSRNAANRRNSFLRTFVGLAVVCDCSFILFEFHFSF